MSDINISPSGSGTDVQLYVPPAEPPINRMPVDVLLNIFHLSTYSGEDSDEVDMPVVLSHVCRKWRDLAVQTPTLWRTVAVTGSAPSFARDALPIYPSLSDPNVSSLALPFAQMFLTRSNQVSIDVCLDLRSPEPDFSLPDIADDTTIKFTMSLTSLLLGLVVPHAHRIRDFTLLSDVWPTVMFSLWKLRNIPMPILRKWMVVRTNVYHCFNDDFRPRNLKAPLPIFSNPSPAGTASLQSDFNPYPNLSNVVLNGSHVEWSGWTVGNLKSLTINFLAKEVRPTLSQLACILKASSHSLERLELQGSAPVILSDNPTAPFSAIFMSKINLPHLRELVLGYTNVVEAMPLIHGLHVPQLKSLALYDLERTFYPGAHVGELPRPISNASIIFEALLRSMPYPLSSIEELTLDSVTFAPPPPNSASGRDAILGSDIANLNISPRAIMPMRLLLSLTKLKSLHLTNPDPVLLVALNTPVLNPAANDGRSDIHFVFPGSSLQNISLLNTCEDLQYDFLRVRSLWMHCITASHPSPYTLPVLENMCLTFPGGRGALFEVCEFGNIDLTTIAKAFNVLYAQRMVLPLSALRDMMDED